jgi:OOP family OmpA-OmpF porin
MIKQLNTSLLVAGTLAALTAGSSAFAQTALKEVVLDTKTPAHKPYVIDNRGVVVRSGFGLCWRTGYWTPQLAATTPVVGSAFPAGCECDKDLMPKEACEPKAAPAAAPAAPAAPAAAPAPKPAAEKITLAADALFDFDKAVLRPEGKAKLDDVVSKLNQIALEVIIAVGHTDRIGSDRYNQKLSERRAQSVKDYLIGKGVEPNRIYTEGKGEAQPKTTGCNMKPESGKNRKLVECLQPDRRVEIEIIGTKK